MSVTTEKSGAVGRLTMAGATPGSGPGRPVGLRERHKIRTRAAIRNAAMRLFEQQGYAQTTVEQIAREAEVSHTTFFRYFASKEQVVISDDNDEARGQAIAQLPSGLGRFELLRALLRASYAIVLDDPWASNPQRMRLIHSEPVLRLAYQLEADRSFSEAGAYFAEYLGVDPDDEGLKVFVAAVGGVIFNAADQIEDPGDPESLALMMRSVDLMEQGFPL
ncbi:TetR family transcriptional regulator [Gordonia sp. ABSL1-1]|uniref:TetR/AcrR family transcriptional regulator n=1 Tax=Gordonia sp. ABSL1-1 TaxID=3053923 RepID=UPI0025734CD0|nr:TetR family transcriptional regulator [Gordonia sp. ABSL1-1]MDL9937830.1 TetR family transcriptional regulator [Gordonia sp. ABSL1-1]